MSNALRIGDDRGFTLAELSMAIAVFVVVMTLAGQLIFMASRANTAVSTKASYTTQVAEPIDAISRNLMQATVLEAPTAYSLSFLVNPDLDSTFQRVVVDMGTANGTISIWTTNASQVNVKRISHLVFTKGLRNKAEGKPAFRYYDLTGVELTDYSAVPSRAKSVTLDLRATINGEPVSRSTPISLRNMFGY